MTFATHYLEPDLDGVFFAGDWDEALVLTNPNSSQQTIQAIFDQSLEVMNEEGILDLVQHALTTKAGIVRKEASFLRNGVAWRVGRLVQRAPDGRLETWEVHRV